MRIGGLSIGIRFSQTRALPRHIPNSRQPSTYQRWDDHVNRLVLRVAKKAFFVRQTISSFFNKVVQYAYASPTQALLRSTSFRRIALCHHDVRYRPPTGSSSISHHACPALTCFLSRENVRTHGPSAYLTYSLYCSRKPSKITRASWEPMCSTADVIAVIESSPKGAAWCFSSPVAPPLCVWTTTRVAFSFSWLGLPSPPLSCLSSAAFLLPPASVGQL